MEAAPEMTSAAGLYPTMEHREEPYDPLAIPDVDKWVTVFLRSGLP